MRGFLKIRKLCGDERGVSVVELGLVAPVLALFIAGIIDLSQGLAQRFALQQAVNRSLELVLAVPPEGDPDDADVDYGYVADEAAAAAEVGAEQVTLDRWLQCDEARMDDYTAACADGEDTARYLSVRIQKPFHGSFYVGGMTIVASGVIRIQ